ncbi:MAG: coenzyme F420-0:L-glutamate ligase [Bacillota bacterium]|jgi:F420-0:gamma-glutamyl ligase|nr:coenzyme F420-0:L-glutamate ligase [Bacillota bacterium]HPZ22010.1 coenzyme F420-0:L-glutamate ligase [Bacillota bacterium]HQD19774.1 coenzyme F420-0:L-glutamate ligase [Bacillota bacterium]
MAKLPAYIGPAAFGLKMGVIVPGSNLLAMVAAIARECHEDSLLDDGDVLCITESVLARSQNNYVTIAEITGEIREKLAVGPRGKIGVVFPIVSRNRFVMIMQAIAAAVPQGEVIVQLSWPRDEVGNQIIGEDYLSSLGKEPSDTITPQELEGYSYKHPVTQVDYIDLYRQTIAAQGARATIVLGNDPEYILSFAPDGVIAADVHNRDRTLTAIAPKCKAITLAHLCSSPRRQAWSEWGLLGSNMSSGGKLKLAPREASAFAEKVQQEVARLTGKKIEVLIYGDGAYKDPSTQIYELADPKPVFGATSGFANLFREGVKYKYLVDYYHDQGQSVGEIQQLLAQKMCAGDSTEGTTPRCLEDVIASLADLVSGSADAGTPVVLVKGFFA